jgi:hypothetical protein
MKENKVFKKLVSVRSPRGAFACHPALKPSGAQDQWCDAATPAQPASAAYRVS